MLETLNRPDTGSDAEYSDHLWVYGATAYGRFCVETGRLSEAEPWLRRAGPALRRGDGNLPSPEHN
ncbi:hypothetical protein I551_6934 [Mycobacterium ulcerans str. Harvey]|uniref:Uncharacterized protein n=1 Tax=Mycobacterium ulcerans str. Harvey TaxID=1299332 RepID=A0ABN0QPM1_MYCUL|nr:hypothetical protein I551_6934 [Mycobacterium ulcerans str. Harvey]